MHADLILCFSTHLCRLINSIGSAVEWVALHADLVLYFSTQLRRLKDSIGRMGRCAYWSGPIFQYTVVQTDGFH